MVVVHLPPPLRSITPKFTTLNRNDELIRIFDPTSYNATATSFRNYGPISRFDHHRDMADKLDPQRSVIYAGLSLSCCLVEIFGDGGVIRIEQQQLAFITLKDTLKLLDLRGSAAMAAGTVAALSSITERNISQAWGRYFYDNPQLYGEIDGLMFAMDINIVPVKSEVEFKTTSTTLALTNISEDIFARFLELEVGDGAASCDTIRSYLSQTKQYLDWCKDNLLLPLDADVEDIKPYRQYLVQSGYQNSTIATKLNMVRIFYKAALTHGLIKTNPAARLKLPRTGKIQLLVSHSWRQKN